MATPLLLLVDDVPEIALIVGQHAPALSAFVSWNAKHFVGRLGVPSLTPREWLGREAGRRKRT